MAAFVDDTGTGVVPHIPDPDGVLWDRFGVEQQRTYVFVNDDGTSRIGTYGNLAGDVEELLAG